MPTACHPSRSWDWCVPNDEKQETEKLWAYKIGIFVSDDWIQKMFG